jgi:hypothetical protein
MDVGASAVGVRLPFRGEACDEGRCVIPARAGIQSVAAPEVWLNWMDTGAKDWIVSLRSQ